ncbi:MAG: bifunctional lysylphosphatidylglycerol flippase/synthetase MprF [Nitrospirae bacterium]|nr:bifunctional lysylphosphatidylglycerol flippase/synthetase MprF [Nitrospirota bacterium]
MEKKLLYRLSPLIGIVLFAIALFVIRQELSEYHYHDIVRHLHELQANHVFLAFILTIASYLVLTGYDALSLRYINYPLSYFKIALASFTGYAFSHNVGFAMLSGGSVRFRLYSIWGLSAVDVTKVVIFNGLTFWTGFLTVGSIVFLLEPLTIPPSLHFPFSSAHVLGLTFLVIVAGYVLLSIFAKRPFRFKELEFSVPSLKFSFAQIVISAIDWSLAGSVLFFLLPSETALSYPEVMGIFLLAQIAGLASQVPGGLGVFETVVLIFLSERMTPSAVLGSLIAYRGIYYLLPLAVATVLLGAHELMLRKKAVIQVVSIFEDWVPRLLPNVFAFTIFLGGAILLFSGSTPSVAWRYELLQDFLPVPVMEISHFLGSVAGMCLLIIAWGLQRRLDGAYLITLVLLLAGAVFSLLKGFDYEEAIILSVMFIALLPCRKNFYRKASLTSQRFSPGWLGAILLILLCSVWLGFFSHKHIEYSNEQWWRLTLSGDVPRFLRATIGSIGIALFFAMARLLSPAPPEPKLPGAQELEKVRDIIRKSKKTYANLALLGDKSLLFNERGNAFIMYTTEGRSWVALGDPVGPEEELNELIWRFRETCDRHDGWTAFYEVETKKLPLYLDLGLTLIKLGEEGRVRLETFSLEGGSRKSLRHIKNKLANEGFTFEIIESGNVPLFLQDFKKISDAWLTEKNTREKGFSLGFFDEEYLKEFPAAVIRRDNSIMAFANLWLGGEKEEISIDLMRHLPDAPNGLMDFLFTEIMLFGKKEGYRWFNLGMAPLSGLEEHSLAPLWSKFGSLLFRHGEHFYNFQGLREYKEKFCPEWEPKYLASPGGLALPRILANIATLISGGIKGVVAK